MKRSIYIFLITTTLAVSLVYANDSKVPTDRINKCKTDLKACRVQKAYAYFGYFECQYEYQACKINKPADLGKFHNQVSTSPETQWEISTPEKENLDPEVVQEVIQNARTVQDLYSLLIVKNGKLVSETYFQLKDYPRPHGIASVTKSIVSLLVGIAIDNGYLPSEDVSIKAYFKDYFSIASQSLKESIKIVDLLQMRSGIAFTDQEYWMTFEAKKPGYSFFDYWLSDNAKDYALQFDMSYKPGEKYQYNTPAVSLLTTILNHSTGMNSNEFAKKYLFEPLGIKNYQWAHDSNEYFYGGQAILIRPRALAKIGQMVLNDGVYNSKQIVSSKWLDKVFEVHQIDGVWERVFDSTGAKLGYGYLWYITKLNGYNLHFAYGYGGNFIVIVPKENLLIITTANNQTSLDKAAANPSKIFNGIVSVLLDSI